MSTENIVYPKSAEEMFDLFVATLNKFRDDETITHVYLVAIHGNDPSASPEGAPITFHTNIPDLLEAAVTLNNVTAGMAMYEQNKQEQATRN